MRKGDGRLRDLGEQIRARRASANLTQDELGKRAGIVGKYVSEIERGTRDVPLSTLIALVEQGLGLRLELQFLSRNGNRPEPRPPSLPSPVEEIALAIAALPADERTRVIAIIRNILSLVE